MLILMLIFIPVMLAGLVAAVNILPNRRKTIMPVFLLMLAMVSSIQLSLGYQDVYLDVTVFVLFSVDLSLLVHLVFKSKYQSIKKDNEIRNRFQLVIISFAVILLLITIQGSTLEITEIGLYIYYINLYLNLLLLALLFYLLSKLEAQTSTILLCIVGFSVCNSLLGLLQYATNKSLLLFSAEDSINYYEGVKIAKRVVGFVGASNGAGNLGAILFPVLLYYFIQKKSLFSLAAVLLNTVFLFLTFTRIGYLSVSIQFLIFLFYVRMGTRYRLLKKLGTIFVAVFAAVLAYQIFYDQLFRILFLDRGDTESHRFVQFNMAFRLLKEHAWFGLGAGQYVPYMQAYHGIDDIALHSQFINVLVEQGIFGFILFFLVYAALFIWSLGKYKGERWFPAALFLGNFIVVNFNPNQYYSLCTYTFFMIAFGLVFARRDTFPRHSIEENRPLETANYPKPNDHGINIMQVNKGA
ncbi:O-antigen ligase family protein [Paenibacillus dokdonensis]|uniref:O-antigen ligase family protein n=1 Tax=Paenibacillus dokdonensis TaxID=2567944 RepID=A0ABU6GGW1_9BACL|nr:O-antigen ligase family protein [Paenibacillus dokdonensis]MEC0238967.1 O-antigen ligase family protein [Paenibacillus dokdonensis]